MRNITKNVVEYAKGIANSNAPRPIKFGKINWRIVCASHGIYKRRGAKGHRTRQEVRSKLWKIVQKHEPTMKKTTMERIFGVGLVHRVKKFFAFKT